MKLYSTPRSISMMGCGVSPHSSNLKYPVAEAKTSSEAVNEHARAAPEPEHVARQAVSDVRPAWRGFARESATRPIAEARSARRSFISA
jgi:hypothetical protein